MCVGGWGGGLCLHLLLTPLPPQIPLHQLSFSKEVRLGTYRQPPPAAQLAAGRLQRDAADITLYVMPQSNALC